MKVDCIRKTIDVNRIHWAIDEFKVNHYGNEPSYIVMNFETNVELISDYYDVQWAGSKVSALFGIPVAFNEGLKFGEVDIV